MRKNKKTEVLMKKQVLSLFLLCSISAISFSALGMQRDMSTTDSEQPLTELDEQLKKALTIDTGLISSYEDIKSLIQQGASVNIGSIEGNTPIYFSVLFEDLEKTKKWIQLGAEIDRKNVSSLTPLLMSAMQNNMPITTYLLEHGGIKNIDSKSSFGAIALNIAIKNKNRKMQKLLLGWGANPVDEATTKLRDALIAKTKLWNENIGNVSQAVQIHVPVIALSHLILEYICAFEKDKPLDFEGRVQQKKDRSLQNKRDIKNRLLALQAPGTSLNGQKEPYEKK
jgi:hypothetical protein